MSDIKLPDGDARRHMSAMVWATRLHTGPLTGRELRALSVWRAVPQNQRALDDSDALWQTLEELRSQSAARARRMAGTSTLKIAACVATLTVGIGLAARTWIDAQGTAFETQVGEWRSVSFVDGTVSRLGPSTLIRVKSDERQREVRVVRGEALFDVAKDPARPFLAEADGDTARALGTKFAMTTAEGSPVITVAEGEVFVYRTESKGDDGVKLPAGKQVTVGEEGSMVPRDVNAASALAWAEGRLEGGGQPVAEIVKEFNRRNRVQIRVENARAAAIRVFGEFSLDDPEFFAIWLSRVGGVIVVRDTPDRLLLISPGAASDDATKLKACSPTGCGDDR